MGDRADVELVRRGLARSRRHAGELVATGRVSVDGSVVAKPSLQVSGSALLVVEPDPADPGWASRAGAKLAGALEALDGDDAGRRLTDRVPGARCLDLGASTGGFTDVLLRRGAASVVAHSRRTEERSNSGGGAAPRRLVFERVGACPVAAVSS